MSELLIPTPCSVPKQPDPGIIVDDPKWHPECERNEKSRRLVGHSLYGFAENEGHSHCHRTANEHPTEHAYDEVHNEVHASILGAFDMLYALHE